MPQDYTEFQDDAQEMIQESGFPVVLHRSGEYDFNNDSSPGGQTWGGHAVLQGSLSSAATRSMAAFSDGGLVTSQSKELLLVVDGKRDALDRAFCPAQGDTVTFHGETWNIVAVDTSEPGGVPIMHTLVLGKA